MILSNRYKEIMDHVEVTDEMAARICRNLQDTKPQSSKSRRKPGFRNLLAAAACLAVCVSLVSIFSVKQNQKSEKPPMVSQSVNNMAEVSSRAELSERVGFDVAELTVLPFLAEQTTYTAYPGGLAQIRYSTDAGTLTFRQSPGTDDNSGDYTDYAYSEDVFLSDTTATLKGSQEGRYTLALWQADGMSYSIKSDFPLSASAFSDILAGVSTGE